VIQALKGDKCIKGNIENVAEIYTSCFSLKKRGGCLYQNNINSSVKSLEFALSKGFATYSFSASNVTSVNK